VSREPQTVIAQSAARMIPRSGCAAFVGWLALRFWHKVGTAVILWGRIPRLFFELPLACGLLSRNGHDLSDRPLSGDGVPCVGRR
jgi:hypothetical protein